MKYDVTREHKGYRELPARTWLAVAGIALLMGVFQAEVLADPNVLWESRDGLSILSTHHLPHVDSWSWTVAGRPWVPNSWGWDVVLGAADRVGGGLGLACLNLVFVGVLVAVLVRASSRVDANLSTVIVAVGGIGGLILPAWITVRPQLASYLFVLGIVPASRHVLRSRGAHFAVGLAGLGAAQAAWMNLHFFAIVGPVLVAAVGVGLLLRDARGRSIWAMLRAETSFRVVLAVAVCVLACAATPYGTSGLMKSIQVRNAVTGLVVEWQPAGFATYTQFTAVLALAVAAVAMVHSYRRGRWEVTAVLAVLAAGAATACRFAPALTVVALPEFAAVLDRIMRRRWLRRCLFTATSAVGVLGVGVCLVGAGRFASLRPASESPRLIAALPTGCRLVNDYPLGGAVLFLRADVRVSVDSRTDLYGRSGVLANRALLQDRPDPTAVLDSSAATCVLAPSDSPLVVRLHREPGWAALATDRFRTLLVRRN